MPRLGRSICAAACCPATGAAVPVNWVLVHGEPETGVTLHYMEERAGPGRHRRAETAVPITPEDTAVTLFARMTVAARAALIRGQAYPPGSRRAATAPPDLNPQDQRPGLLFRRPPARTDGLSYRWRQQHATLPVYNLVAGRAPTPIPGAFTHALAGRKLYHLGRHSPMAATYVAVAPDAGSRAWMTGGSLPGKGLLVATGQGHFLITQAQWEGQPESLGPSAPGHLWTRL